MAKQWGAIIVCGGKSSRMETAKAMLPFGPETVLQRIARIVREAIAGPIVVVAAKGQELPPLFSKTLISYDETEGLGPLEGLRVGMAILSTLKPPEGVCEAVFATSCDVPLLRPEFIREVCRGLTDDVAAAVPRSEGYLHPLAAAYRIDAVLPHLERLVAARKLRAAGLFDDVPTRILDEPELRAPDPQLESLRNMNTQEDYRELLRLAGFAANAADS